MCTSSRIREIFCLFFVAFFLACQQNGKPGEESGKQNILAVLRAQEGAWNDGDIAGFMEGYLKSDSLRFASGDAVTYGWQTTLERYRKAYPNRDRMGHLTFEILKTDLLAENVAAVFGRWKLERTSDAPHGLFTLLLKKTPAGWRIFADHTSSATEK